MNQSVNALNDQVLIEPITQNDLRAQFFRSRGFYAANTKYEGAPYLGKVLSVGIGIEAAECKVGDIVAFRNEQPDGFKFNGQKYLPVEYNNVMGVVRGLK